MGKSTRFLLVGLHVLVWLVIISFTSGILMGYLPFAYVVGKMALSSSFFVIIFYGAALVLIPFFFEKGKYVELIVLSLIFLMLIVLARHRLEEGWLPGRYGEPSIDLFSHTMLASRSWLRLGASTSITFFLGALYRLAYREVLRRNQKNEILALKYETELQNLLHQVNPHFLFNSIHNIYTLAVVGDDRTAPMLLSLSGVLRHSLYHSNEPLSPLVREVKMINDVLDIYSMKYEYFPLANIELRECLEGHKVPSLIFLPLIENMFKHGDERKEGWKLDLHLDGRRLDFMVQNPIRREYANEEEGSGIGLTNVEKRLALIFDGDYSFEAGEEGEIFRVQLNIPLI